MLSRPEKKKKKGGGGGGKKIETEGFEKLVHKFHCLSKILLAKLIFFISYFKKPE